MELLERYLQAVRTYLLRRRKDDIVKELGDNILSQMEDKAADLGRPLTEAEQSEVLKQHGHPVVAAARYGRLPLQYLIGPTLFPIFWYAVQLVVGFLAAFHLMMVFVMLFGSRGVLSILIETWTSFWFWSITALGATTLAFALIEYFGKGKIPLTDTFNPLDLPLLQKASAPVRGNSVAELVLGSLFIVGWLIFLHAPAPSFAEFVPVHLAPVWYQFEIPMLLTVAMGMAAAYVHLFQAESPRLRIVLRLLSDVVGVITFYFFLGANRFVTLRDMPAISDPVYFGRVMITKGQLINYAAGLPALITMIVLFMDGLIEATRLIGRLKTATAFTHRSNGTL
jgi:uncharacterized membrane protein